jgi:hypothetical protein
VLGASLLLVIRRASAEPAATTHIATTGERA